MPRRIPTRQKKGIRPFRFESYGVKVEITGNDQSLIDEAGAVTHRSLLGELRTSRANSFHHRFELDRTAGGWLRMARDGERLSSGRSWRKFFKLFDAIIRVTIAESAPDRVFLHAGVVGWRGQAILMPGDSFQGKSTLVAELVRMGAEYYSDDFAVLDPGGRVHPFARPVSMRTDDGHFSTYEIGIKDLGGRPGREPIPVGLILFTFYKPEQRVWRPRTVSQGRALMDLLQFSLPLRRRPELSLSVLDRIVRTAAASVAGARGDAAAFAPRILKYADRVMRPKP
jgi:hypothetical protein